MSQFRKGKKCFDSNLQKMQIASSIDQSYLGRRIEKMTTGLDEEAKDISAGYAIMKKEFNDWLSTRPEIIKKMGEKWPPWNRYRLKTTGQHCYLCSYSEDETVTITIYGHDTSALDAMNQMLPRNVFGVNPEDLEIIQ